MDGKFIHALEMRAKWLQWAKKEGQRVWDQIAKYQFVVDNKEIIEYNRTLPVYTRNLEIGDTYFVNKEFASIVDGARETVPDSLTFDVTWMQSNDGFLWLETPFEVPTPEEFTGFKMDLKVTIAAIGWMKVADDAYHFLTYQDFKSITKLKEGFGCWSYFTLRDGDELITRIRDFESAARNHGGYKKDRTSDLKHEMRWVYAVCHLMAQRISHHSSVQTAKHIVKQGVQNNRPVTPFIRVISLRRMEEEREKLSPSERRNWHWRWSVRGHWRKVFLRSKNRYEQIYIESYVKGPSNKPFKPLTHNMFLARR